MSTAACILVQRDWSALIRIKHGAGRNATFYALPDHSPTCRCLETHRLNYSPV
jgi:hypothetical protein